MKWRPGEIDQLYGLEPVFEPGNQGGSDELECFVEVACPYCAEAITARVDLSGGDQSYIEDCQVCCQAIQMSIRLTEQGQLHELLAERADG